MNVRVEMYRILLGCINSPDLTIHFRFELVKIGLDWVSECFSLSLILI